ncbi:MAG: DUF255 domain-containing protein [Fimbriimonadaceae bacterium]|nr:DUF255 domain-containing protein [Fimbriimonadaceae bacterium]
MPNRLADSTSPYLRQHADNPVDWFPWDDEAWAKAKAENKPVFLSVGYSSCHWCHVMAHESFEDAEVAAYLNEHFVNIKLDREERPDVDDIYMTATQLATGHGGWPMSVFLTPDAKPFFAGTYYPKFSQGQMPSFTQVIQALANAWREEESDIREKAEEFTAGLQQVLERSIPPMTDKITVSLLDQAIHSFHQEFDEEQGGFGGAPKFPPFSTLRFLLRYAQTRHLLPGSQEVVTHLVDSASFIAFRTLEAMALGGIRDHVGGGFHRYSTDERWLLPHFEKMLTDNAQMIELYAHAAELADDKNLRALFTEVADQTVGWVLREMSLDGAFATALDADTSGEEGLTYVWTKNEIHQLVPDGQSLCDAYQIVESGNFYEEATGHPTGTNIPHLVENASRDSRLDLLLEARNLRVQPGQDDKALLSANALLISGFVAAGYVEESNSLADYWLNRFNEYLPHQMSDTHAAFLDGYSYFCRALLDLGRTEDAGKVADQLVESFADTRGFFFNGTMHEELIGRQKPFLDQAVPSSNGIAIEVLRRLGRNEEALNHLTAAYGWAQRAPAAAGTILIECLEQLLLGNDSVETNGDAPQIQAELDNSNPELTDDGYAYVNLTIRIPNGFHINDADPGAEWLIPSSVEITGSYAEASWPDSVSGQYRGEIELAIRLKPRGSIHDFQIDFRYQLCSDSECYQPQTVTLNGQINPGKVNS